MVEVEPDRGGLRGGESISGKMVEVADRRSGERAKKWVLHGSKAVGVRLQVRRSDAGR